MAVVAHYVETMDLDLGELRSSTLGRICDLRDAGVHICMHACLESDVVPLRLFAWK